MMSAFRISRTIDPGDRPNSSNGLSDFQSNGCDRQSLDINRQCLIREVGDLCR